MSTTRQSPTAPATHRRSSAVLAVTSVLVPPAAWALSLGLSYVLEDFTCSAAATADAAAPRQGLMVVLVVLNVLLLAVTLLAGAGGVIGARRSRGAQGPGVLQFLGYLGAGLALVFAFGIVLIGANPFVLEVCG